MSTEGEVLNGVLPDGTYAHEPLADEVLGERLLAHPEGWQHTAGGAGSRYRRPTFGVAEQELGEAGWAVVTARGKGDAALRELRELLDHREQQAGGLYKELEVLPDDDCDSFLRRYGAPPGDAIPTAMPYYLLLVGSPSEISFELQYELAQSYAVGRLDFERPEDYRAYARAAVTRERGGGRPRRRAVTLFSVQNPGDGATRRTTGDLALPLADVLAREAPGWTVERIVREEATRERLGNLLARPAGPALLFAGGHGMVFPPDDGRQRALQGALLCSDWGGPKVRTRRSDYLAAEDLPEGADVDGLILFLFACYGGGTPALDSFPPAQKKTAEETERERAAWPRRLTNEPFTAELPRQLLLRGAQAVVAHVDRAWTSSFHWSGETGNPETFASTLRSLMAGHRIGWAMEHFGARWAALSVRMLRMWQQRLAGREVDPRHFARHWRAANDVRSYVILGDPAARITP